MGQSGNPAKKATKKTSASSIADFKKRAKGELKELPSGLVVRMKRVDLQTFILQGTVPNPLMEIVSEALEKGKKADIPKMMGAEDGKLDLTMVNDMYEILNALVCASVIEPPINPLPTDAEGKPLDGVELENAKDDELVYVDEVDELDKMFIFQWNTGGVGDLETFRREARADLDALAEGKSS